MEGGNEGGHRLGVLLGLHLSIIPKSSHFPPPRTHVPRSPASQDLLLPDIRAAQGKSQQVESSAAHAQADEANHWDELQKDQALSGPELCPVPTHSILAVCPFTLTQGLMPPSLWEWSLKPTATSSACCP